MKKLIVAIMLLGGGIIFSSNANNRLKTLLPSKLVYRKMSYSVQPNASKPTTADKYIFTAVESANYGTATG